MLIQFQAVVVESSAVRTVVLGDYEVPCLPPGGTVVVIPVGVPSPEFGPSQMVYGTVSSEGFPTTLHIPRRGVDAIVFLERVMPHV